MSQCKLFVVVGLLVVTLGVYAREVNEASTKWYFLKQEMQNYDELVFQHSSIKLDVLQLEKWLWNQISSQQAAWANKNKDRTLTVYTYNKEVALK